MTEITRNRNSVLKRGLFFALAGVSILLTAGFFTRNVRFESLDNIHPIFGTFVSVCMGLIAADIGALAWREIYLRSCRSAAQVFIAQTMIGLTLLMATVTTIIGIGESYSGVALIPDSWGVWIGWLIVLTIGIEFIGGAFLFSLYEPEVMVQREIMSALVEDSAAVALEIRGEMEKRRNQRVRVLTDQLTRSADQLIYDSLSSNSRTLPLPIDTRSPNGSPGVIRESVPGESRFFTNGRGE